MENQFDVIVVGLGIMGSSTLYALSKRGKSVMGIDQFSPPHRYGSSHGDTRVFRQAIGEGEEYMPLIKRASILWKDWEKEGKQQLFTKTGGLFIMKDGSTLQKGDVPFWDMTINNAKKYNIEHSFLSSRQIQKKFPQFSLTGKELGYYEKNMGFLRPELSIKTFLNLAKKNKSTIRSNEKVQSITDKKTHVEVKTNKNTYKAKRVILTAGSWIPELLPAYKKYFQVKKQNIYWYDTKNTNSFIPGIFPIFVWFPNSEDYIYAFPAIDGPNGGMKVVPRERWVVTSKKGEATRITAKKKKEIYETYYASLLPKMIGKCLRAVPCLYVSTPDRKFVLDFHPEYKNIIIASPCSGHGFKYAPAIGEILSQLAIDGKSTVDISPFTINRFRSGDLPQK